MTTELRAFSFPKNTGELPRKMASLRSVALALIIIVVILAIGVFGWKTYERRGDKPSFAREVFLWFNPANSAPGLDAAATTAATLRSLVATPGQVSLYAADGGGAAGAGITSTGDVYWAPGAAYTGSGAVEKLGTSGPNGPTFPYGIWLVGPKPAKGTTFIIPFNAHLWYQKSGAAPSSPSSIVDTTASRLATARRRFARRTRGLSQRHI